MTSPSPHGAEATPPRRRADAERNIAAILDAALTCLGSTPEVSMADVAKAAGVGRVTLYGHFPSREALVEAVLDHAIRRAEPVIAASRPDDGPADEALSRLLHSAWQVLDQHRRLFDLAQRVLGPTRLRERHEAVVNHVEQLLARGRADGVLRTDLPLDWLATTVYTLLHAAADDVSAGRLQAVDAAHVLDATLRSALTTPAGGSMLVHEGRK